MQSWRQKLAGSHTFLTNAKVLPAASDFLAIPRWSAGKMTGWHAGRRLSILPAPTMPEEFLKMRGFFWVWSYISVAFVFVFLNRFVFLNSPK